MKKASEIKGLLVTSNKTFYWLETGNISISNTLDRIQKVLIAKDILTYSGIKEDSDEKLKLMTLADAQEKGYTIQTLYLNNHVKSTINTQPTTEEKVTWGKKKK